MSYSVSEIIGKGLRTRIEGFVEDAKNIMEESMMCFFSGEAGLGKSMSAEIIKDAVTTEGCCCDELIGGQLDSSKVRSLIEDMHYKSMYGGRVLWVDEADSITKGAQVDVLKLLDMAMRRPGWAFLFTTNQPFSYFDVRFPDRCSKVSFSMPTHKELEEGIRERHPTLPKGDIDKIIENSASVRSCLHNAKERAKLRERMK